MEQGVARVVVDYGDLDHYLTTFFDEDNPIKELQILPTPVNELPPDELVKRIDILPILRAKAHFPHHFNCNVAWDDELEEWIDNPIFRNPLQYLSVAQLLRDDQFWKFGYLDDMLKNNNEKWLELLRSPSCPFQAMNSRVTRKDPDIFGIVQQQFIDSHLTNLDKVDEFLAEMDVLNILYLMTEEHVDLEDLYETPRQSLMVQSSIAGQGNFDLFH